MTTSLDWTPSASLTALQERAELYAQLRQFFAARDVLEVDTQLLSQGTITDPHIEAFSSDFNFSSSGEKQTLFLQTSPEYAMKRLLASYGKSIYQLSKAFRHEGFGRWHNPEFTILEWYRVGMDHHQLMDEVAALLQTVLAVDGSMRMSYQQVFMEYLDLDPLTASTADIAKVFNRCQIDLNADTPIDHTGMLQLLFSSEIEPLLGEDIPCFIYGYPASQSSLAKLNAEDPRIADRFELFYRGAELANGFNELLDEAELRRRFVHDNRLRHTFRLPTKPIDERFLGAMLQTVPACAGVALGVDRLLMLKHGYNHIQQVLAFPIDKA